MTYENRVDLYNQIEEMRERPLISYITSSRQNASAQMAQDIFPGFIKQIEKIPDDKKKIDLLVVSRGGDPIVPLRIISILRERFTKIGILLPYEAFSAATLLALGCDEIIMHSYSNLGPVDPQLTGVRRIPGSPNQKEKISFGSEDLRHYLSFINEDVGISDQEQMEKAFELMCKDVGAIPIGIAKKSSNLALSMGEKLLGIHMKDQSKAKAIAEALNRSFFHHGYALGRKDAIEIGLPVKSPPNELAEKMWNIWQDISDEMEINTPFDPLEKVLADPSTASIIGPVPQAQIPSNLPPAAVQQAINRILGNINVVMVPPVDYELFTATIESTRCKSNFKIQGKITSTRMPDMNIALNVIKTSQKWIYSET